MSEVAFTEVDRLTIALALDALDRCLDVWVNDTKLTDEQGRVFTAALMAANRIVNRDTDGSPKGRDATRLDGEATTAGAGTASPEASSPETKSDSRRG